jgi:hypothetical protein
MAKGAISASLAAKRERKSPRLSRLGNLFPDRSLTMRRGPLAPVGPRHGMGPWTAGLPAVWGSPPGKSPSGRQNQRPREKEPRLTGAIERSPVPENSNHHVLEIELSGRRPVKVLSRRLAGRKAGLPASGRNKIPAPRNTFPAGSKSGRNAASLGCSHQMEEEADHVGNP